MQDLICLVKGLNKKNGSRKTITNNEIKDIVKVIKSLENRGILLIGNTRKITSQKGGLFNLLRPLMKNILLPSAKSVLIPLGLATAAWATDAAIQKKIFGSGTISLIISNKELEDIMKIVKSLEESRLRIKWISETIKNEAKKIKRRISN